MGEIRIGMGVFWTDIRLCGEEVERTEKGVDTDKVGTPNQAASPPHEHEHVYVETIVSMSKRSLLQKHVMCGTITPKASAVSYVLAVEQRGKFVEYRNMRCAMQVFTP